MEADAPPEAIENSLTASTLIGDWKLAPSANAMGVGPSPGSYAYWASGEETITERHCLFDDVFRFGTGGAFFILSSDTGEFLWSENISSNKQLPKIFHSGDIVANPIFHKGVIYIVSQSGFTAAFDINTSEELWKIPVGGIETPTLSGKTIFVNGHMGLLTAIDIKSGKLRWKKKYPSYINENSLFSDKEIAIYKGPTLVDSKILLSSLDGKIIIIDANNGNEISTLKIDKLALSPIPVDKKLFFLTTKGKLLAYE